MAKKEQKKKLVKLVMVEDKKKCYEGKDAGNGAEIAILKSGSEKVTRECVLLR